MDHLEVVVEAHTDCLPSVATLAIASRIGAHRSRSGSPNHLVSLPVRYIPLLSGYISWQAVLVLVLYR